MPTDPKKVWDFQNYTKFRTLGDYVSPAIGGELRRKILAERQRRIAQLEETYPDFAEVYERYKR